MFGVMQSLDIHVCEDAADAIAEGFDYTAPEFKPIEIHKVVIVRKGTEGGNPSVDLVLRDESGQLFVVMLTGNLLKALPL